MNFCLAVLEFLAGYILIVSVLVWMASKILP